MVAVLQSEIPPSVESATFLESGNGIITKDEEESRPLVGIIYPPPDIRSILLPSLTMYFYFFIIIDL